ncbi:hypothetical protein B7494_g5837 [Chlorociboria aeruginascens]|nr:hypothetical protein B7494_g5837 [Chlorociboria aeruginascens]
MRIRLRGPAGASAISLPDNATVADLISLICEKTGIANFDIKYGYPPKPLHLSRDEPSLVLSELHVKLDGEQLTISQKHEPLTANEETREGGRQQQTGSSGPVSLKRKSIESDVPELPLPERGATLVLRIMPDDNSCLFRAFGAAVLPIDDKNMRELRSLVASSIQAEPNIYTKVVLEQDPDDYCRWITTDNAWGGAIEMGILSKHFDVEICSVDVQSLRVDKFNEGAPNRCILVYSGIHYDTIVQSPSEPPHLKADSPPELDRRVWDSADDEIVLKAVELCRKLQEKHYWTDTGKMAIKCNVCGKIVYGEGQAAQHAQQTNHYDMAEVK